MKKVLIFDTSVLCCLLKVPGKGTAGPENDRWDYARIAKLVKDETKAESTFVLPLATIIETGNQIAQAAARRYETAQELARMISAAAAAETPWAAFTEQADLWGTDQMHKLADTWPDRAAAHVSIGDATIVDVAEYYATAGYRVELVTGDEGLKAHEPTRPPARPRRR
jgi:hypothetical protein